MHPQHKRNSIIGLGIGLAFLAPGAGLLIANGEPKWLIALFVLAGIPFYVWGCVQLAEAKGYPKAIAFTAVLGLLFPLVLLLALPDRRRQFRRRINQP